MDIAFGLFGVLFFGDPDKNLFAALFVELFLGVLVLIKLHVFCFGESFVFLLLAKGDLPSASTSSFPLSKHDFVGVRLWSGSLSDSELQTGLGIFDFLLTDPLLSLILLGLDLNPDTIVGEEFFAFLGGLILVVGKKWFLIEECLFGAFSWS